MIIRIIFSGMFPHKQMPSMSNAMIKLFECSMLYQLKRRPTTRKSAT